MLLFGLVLLLAAWVGTENSVGDPRRSPEAEATEAREHRLGLERDAR